MNQEKLLTTAQMHAQVASQQADLEQIQTVLNEKLTNEPAAAQAKRLVALGLAKEAAHILKQAAGTVQYLVIKEEPGQADELKKTVKAQVGAIGELLDVIVGEGIGANLAEPMGEMVDTMIEMVEGMAEQMAESMGVMPEAIGPFIIECTSMMLASSGNMISQAKAKLEAADTAESAAS